MADEWIEKSVTNDPEMARQAAEAQAKQDAIIKAHQEEAKQYEYDRSKWMAARDSGYDEQLTGRLLAYYGQTKGKGNKAVNDPAVIKQMTRQAGESYNAWMQRLNASFP